MSSLVTVPRFDRLFHVLVVLGAASCADEDGTSERELQVDAAAAADAVSTPEGDAAGGDGAELAVCFCNVDPCCDRSGTTAVLAPGFECCWSTTCP